MQRHQNPLNSAFAHASITDMTDQVSLSCSCGKIQGVAFQLAHSHAKRIACLCDDCQTFAHFLGRAGEILDENGGTDILPVAPAHLKITQGLENLKCVRLSPHGMYRWYAGCCKTPIANIPQNPKFPYAGVIHLFMNHKADHQTRDEALGPLWARIQGKFGYGKIPPGTPDRMNFKIALNMISFALPAFLKRQSQPSPFFNQNLRPVVEPQVLSKEERANLRKLLTSPAP